jgi:hypothetical protein
MTDLLTQPANLFLKTVALLPDGLQAVENFIESLLVNLLWKRLLHHLNGVEFKGNRDLPEQLAGVRETALKVGARAHRFTIISITLLGCDDTEFRKDHRGTRQLIL